MSGTRCAGSYTPHATNERRFRRRSTGECTACGKRVTFVTAYGITGHPRVLDAHDVPAPKPAPLPKRTIRQNRYDNWFGYEAGRRVIEFGNSREFTAAQYATAWVNRVEPTHEREGA